MAVLSERVAPLYTGPRGKGRAVRQQVRCDTYDAASGAPWRGALQGGLLAGLLCCAGCSSLADVDPVGWWHTLQGGEIAQERPPPPNADEPYRALGSIPDKPVPTDPAARGRIADALVADRANAQYESSLSPIPPPPPRPKPPAAAAGGSDVSGASLAAASAPPAPPKRAPAAPVKATPLPAPDAPAPDSPNPVAPLPGMSETPPPPPALAGVPAATVPTPPPVAPPPASPPAAIPVAGAPVAVAFAAGSSVLPSSALPGLKLLAQTRAGGRIAVVGYGDAAGAAPDAQARVLPLALARAQAVAAQLLTAGVPSEALRIDAEAAGSGAVARVVK